MKTNLGYIMPYEPDSGQNSAGDFNFFFQECTYDRHFCKDPEESIDSIDKLLKKRKHSIREIIEETGEAKEKVLDAVVEMIDKGKAIFTGFRNVNGTDEAQLSLFEA
jgi:hypothetical protein